MDEQGDVPMQVSDTLPPENHGLSNASEPAAGTTVGPAGAETVSDRLRTPFAAFISYRHTEPDCRWAKWLHSALERYRVPKQLARQLGVSGRVGRIFRDEEELAAASDLSAGIREALQNSEYLIVVCSPRTAPGSSHYRRASSRRASGTPPRAGTSGSCAGTTITSPLASSAPTVRTSSPIHEAMGPRVCGMRPRAAHSGCSAGTESSMSHSLPTPLV
jgi:MTH538 TIR-like domain (DUF1863)